MQRIPFLDIAKGIAILTIICFHYFWNVPDLSQWQQAVLLAGGGGVHIFFLLSGFGLFLQQSKRSVSAWKFYCHQFPKVYIPYIIAVTAVACFAFIFPRLTTVHSRYAYFGHVFLYKMFDPTIIESYGTHFWFLSTLFQLYFFVPCLIRITKKIKIGRVLGGSFLLLFVRILICNGHTFGWRATNLELLRPWKSFFLQYLWEVVLGMFLAKQYLQTGRGFWERSLRKWVIAGIVCYGIYGGLSFWGGSFGRTVNDGFGLVGYTAGCIGVFHCLKYIPWAHQFVTFLGKKSYTLYLYHILLLVLFATLFRRIGVDDTFTRVCCVFVCTIGSVRVYSLGLKYVAGFRKIP